MLDVSAPAVVLGSAQQRVLVSEHAAGERGVEIAVRRSGGGAVWLAPNQSLWIDLIIARDDTLWCDDVGQAMWWVGDMWRRTLRAISVPADEIAVHHGGLITTKWSKLVCFDGLGPGEVTLRGAKLVGISQRRTRDAARFQCVAYLSYHHATMLAVLDAPKPGVGELAPVATLSCSAAEVLVAVRGSLASY
jgi:lipoate---protein ligase